MKKILKILAVTAAVAATAVMAVGCGGNPETENKPTKRTHDPETHISNLESGKPLPHNFVDGQCTLCDETTIYRQDPLSKAPDILKTEQQKQGTLEYFWYRTRAYGVEAKKGIDKELWIYKRAFVYLPYGYDKANTQKKYNVLYMMHGDGLNEGYWFAQGSYTPQDSNYTGGYGTENVLDYLAANNISEDTIYVSMTMYQYYEGEGSGDPENPNYLGGTAEQNNVYSGYIDPDYDTGDRTGLGRENEGSDSEYWKEWQYHLMPYIVENYNTYAASTSEADLIAAREHVGFTGLSRGGASLACVLKNCLRYVSYFGYESTMLPDDATIRLIKENEKTYPVKYMFFSCGSQESVAQNDAIVVKIKQQLGWKEGSDIKGGDKIAFIQVNKTGHNYETWITNLYNLMMVFFK